MNLNQDLSIFEKILNKEIPATCIYEDEYTFAFKDISPKAPVHILVILKKKKYVNISDISTEEDMMNVGRLMFAAKKVAEIEGVLESGYRLVINNGPDADQTVFYLHCHVIGGKKLS